MSETDVKPRRFWIHFSLTTLLMSVTISAVVFGLLPWQLSVFLLGAIPALLTTLLGIRRGKSLTRGQFAVLVIAWVAFYPVSIGPVVAFTAGLFRTNESLISAIETVYYPLVWAANAHDIEPIAEYVVYWEQMGHWIGGLPELNVGKGRV